ncbi:MAG: AAA family ATPase [Ignavibacteria bacterium]
MSQYSPSNSQIEAFEHLWNGRYRLALPAAERAFKEKPDDSDSAICLAWALLENGNPAKAMEYADLAVELSGSSQRSKMYRGFLLMRMSIFEGALSDVDSSIEQQKKSLAWSYRNKARTLAGLGKFAEGKKSLELAILIDSKKNQKWVKSKEWYSIADDIKNGKIKVRSRNAQELIEKSIEAIKNKDYWFALFISNQILNNNKITREQYDAELLNLEAMMQMFQVRLALKKAKEMEPRYKTDKKFNSIYSSLLKLSANSYQEKDEEVIVIKPKPRVTKDEIQPKTDRIEIIKSPLTDNSNSRINAIYFPNDDVEVFSTKVFDVTEENKTGNRVYYTHFDAEQIKEIAVEIIFNNPFFRIQSRDFIGEAVWLLNDYEIKRTEFSLKVNEDWDSVIFAQNCSNKSWGQGQARVDIYISQFLVCQKWFVISDSFIKEKEEAPIHEEPEPTYQEDKQTDESLRSTKEIKKEVEEKVIRSLDELLEELDKFIGLESVKKAVRDFIDYLEFMKQRKELGLKSEVGLSINAVFTGNPGTGKTTIARLVGEIFKAMGILPKGHVIEVDRASLVGQYIGETAQKTEKVIEEAMGGVLFIDEAYTLVKKGGGGQDFGQEAIDILLKRMEDKKGEFVTIVAGYPDEMENFLNSNPGMKSRFTHFFNFEDYTPEEMIKIFEMLTDKNEYSIDEKSKTLLEKEFTNLYRARDKTFGNARLVRKFFEDAKMQLSKRVLKLDKDKRSKEAMTTIVEDDIKAILSKEEEKDFKVPINEETLHEALQSINRLSGLNSVKKDILEMVKLARYYIEQGEDIRTKFSSHVLFLGNPGTGKTTVARIFSKIYSALGILPKGHLVETDRQGLVASHVGETANKTTGVINKSIGGTLFIDEAYALVKEGNDFGKEAIDTLLKRMEDDRGKFIVIAAGYTNEMKQFIESNPGMQSRFTKTFMFEDYIPDELMEITDRSLKSKELEIDLKAKKLLDKYYNKIYRKRDKNFGNARIVRDLIDKAQQKLTLRLIENSTDDKKAAKILTVDDIRELVNPEQEKKVYQTKGDPEKLKKHLEELNTLTGLDSVKKSVERLISGIKVAQLRKERGLKVVDKNLHSVFLGNPGTGKTTVAHILSNIIKELGLIEKGHLVEVDRSDLVAGYQGQTAIKTTEIINKAIGGTLFIDEAYTLARGGNDFGQEAIDTLIKKMEDLKGQFVVIVAGYPDDMKRFLVSNPGLTSRFTNHFKFEDYTPREMLEITHIMSKSNGYKLDEGALQLLLEIFNDLYDNRDKNFGNARTTKNILMKAISNQEERISGMYDLSDEDLMTIIYEDVEKVNPNQ